MVMASSMLDDDALDHVGDVLAGVDGVLEEAVHVLPLDDVDRVGAIGEEVGNRLPHDAVALVLQAVDLDPVRLDALEALELLERADDLLALQHDDARLLGGGRRRRVDLVQDAGVGDLLDEVDDVVQAADELVDVLAVERRDEGLRQALADVVADAVAAALRVAQLAGEPLALVVGAEQLLEHPGAGEDVLRVLDEQVEELLLARDEGQAHGWLRSPCMTVWEDGGHRHRLADSGEPLPS